MPSPFVILTALKEELAAVQPAIGAKSHVTLARGGVGAKAATAAALKIFQANPRPTMICSSGFCGGLNNDLRVGDVVLASRILDGSGKNSPIDCDAALVAAWKNALENAKVSVRVGVLVSAASAVTKCDDKRALGVTNQACAVDMESYAIATQARVAGAAVMALRAVSDSVDDELPAEVGSFLDEAGNVRAASVAKFAMSHPRNMKTLWGLKSRSDKAAAGLTAAWKAIGAGWPR